MTPRPDTAPVWWRDDPGLCATGHNRRPVEPFERPRQGRFIRNAEILNHIDSKDRNYVGDLKFNRTITVDS